MIALDVFKKILEENGDKFPLLTLDEFLMEIQKKIAIASKPVGRWPSNTG